MHKEHQHHTLLCNKNMHFKFDCRWLACLFDALRSLCHSQSNQNPVVRGHIAIVSINACLLQLIHNTQNVSTPEYVRTKAAAEYRMASWLRGLFTKSAIKFAGERQVIDDEHFGFCYCRCLMSHFRHFRQIVKFPIPPSMLRKKKMFFVCVYMPADSHLPHVIECNNIEHCSNGAIRSHQQFKQNKLCECVFDVFLYCLVFISNLIVFALLISQAI